MVYLLILRTLSLSSDKIPIASEISTHLNLKILEERSLAYRYYCIQSYSALEKCSQRNRKFSLTFNLQRINKKGPFGFLFVPLL